MYLYSRRLNVLTGSDRSSLVSIFESDVIATFNVRYMVVSGYDGGFFSAHVANMLRVDGMWVTICVEMASTLYTSVAVDCSRYN